MAHPLTASPSAPGATTVTVPDGGDARTAASVTTPIQALFNLLMWVVGVLTGSIATALNFTGTVNTTGGNGITSDGPIFCSSLTTQTSIVNARTDVDAGQDVNATRDVNAGRNLSVTGTAAIETLQTIGNGTVGGALLVTGAVGGSSFTTAGAVDAAVVIGKPQYNDVIGVDADHTYSLATTDCVIVDTLTAGRNYTVSIAGAAPGMRISFANFDPTHTLTLLGPFDGSSTFPLLNNTGHNVMVELTLIGSTLYTVDKFAL